MKFDPSKLMREAQPNTNLAEAFSALDSTKLTPAGGPLNLNSYVPTSSLIEEGFHPVMIQDISSKISRKGHTYLLLSYEVVAGENAGMRFEEICNAYHPIKSTRDTALTSLVNYMNAAGIPADKRSFKDESEMLKAFKEANPVKANIGIKKSEGYPDKNFVKSVGILTQDFLLAYDATFKLEDEEDVGQLLEDVK